MKKFVVSLIILSMAVVVFGGAAVARDNYVVASDIPWAPFEMITSDGQFFGFDLDAIRAVAIVAGFDVEIRNIAFDAIIQTVDSGKADLGVSGFTITEEREKTIDFTEPYYLSNQAVVVRKDSDVNIITAMAGLGSTGAVGAQNGTTGYYFVEDNVKAAGLDVTAKGYEFYPTAILDLVNGRIDAVIQDEPASRASLAAYPGKLKIAGIINTYEYFGFLVADGDPNGLLGKINAAVKELGLTVTEGAGGAKELTVTAGSAWDNLLRAYFGPPNEKIEAAWLASKDLLLEDKDVEGFAEKMAEEANK